MLKVDVVGPKAEETYVGKHGVPIRTDLSLKEEVIIAQFLGNQNGHLCSFRLG